MMRGVSFPLTLIIGDGALETRKIDKFLLFNNWQLDNLGRYNVDNHDR